MTLQTDPAPSTVAPPFDGEKTADLCGKIPPLPTVQRRDRRGRFGQGNKVAKGRRQFVPADLLQAVRLAVTPAIADQIAQRLASIATDPKLRPESNIAAAALLVDLLGQ